MRPLSALVVEDEWPARNFLVELLRETGRFGDIAAVTTVQEARQAIGRADLAIDVAFVDVRLIDRPGDTSGLELARWLAGLVERPAVVLATASAEHAVDGFELGAVDYLLKPFALERVRACAARLCERRRPRPAEPPPRRLVARRRDRLVFLELDGMLAFEAAARLTYLHHVEGTYSVDLSLSALAATLGERVLRVHRNWLVAPAHVRALGRGDGDLTLQVGEHQRVPVSRDRAREVRRRLLENALGIAPSG